MRIYVPFIYHLKNQDFINFFIKKNKFKITESIDTADLVLSSSVYFPIENYPNKYFVFGPHFGVLPNSKIDKFNNIHKNAIYLQPSKQAKNVWNSFKSLPITYCPFGVNTEKFVPSDKNKSKVIIYFKRRDPNELKFLKHFLDKKKIKYTLFQYGKYTENNYIDSLNLAKYVIWIGSHESQGFALLECLSMNVPILVWNTTRMDQEYKSTKYNNINDKMQTIPYWDNSCGEYFFNKNELPEKYDIFIKNLKNYNPRKFVIENLSMDACNKKWKLHLKKYFPNIYK